MLKRTLYFSRPAHLHLKDNQMVYKPREGVERTIPIEDIGFVVIESHQITLSVPVLNELIGNNVAVIICNDKHLPASMLLNLDGNSIQTELFSHQFAASVPLKKNMWKQTIEAKIKNQASLLEMLGTQANDLQALARQVKSGDATNREGVAARLYWPRLFGSGFVRDRFGSPPNMLLNYGYTILRAAVARGLIGSGLLPTLGIFHHNRYNNFCLADDIMEPYRPFVDGIVYRIFHAEPDLEAVGIKEKLELLEILSSDVLINNMMRPLMVAVSQSTASLSRCFAQETKRIQYPVFVKTLRK